MTLHPDRIFSPDPTQRDIARRLYDSVAALPLICPHGHVDPRLFADPDYTFGSPVDLLLIPDHYIFRKLYSQGVSLDALGIPRRDSGIVEQDHRRAWQLFADNYYLFRGTPTGLWLREEFADLFAITETLNSLNAQSIYDQIDAAIHQPEFSPRHLFERFNIEVLCTTDAATDKLSHHLAIRESGWHGRILPTFRPDALINLDIEGWRDHLRALCEVSGVDVVDVPSFIRALEQRRDFFKSLGATATDHAALTAQTAHLTAAEAEAIFQRALKGLVTAEDAARFTGHMLIEMARMSADDGLVMQLHVGAYRNHNDAIFQSRGRDMGADIPVASEFTHNLRPLLNAFGNDPKFTLILFTLDETTYSRELAPLAGHYPAVRIGPPWWFFDSLNGMRRYFDQVVETAGLYNTAGFNDDTRAFPSIPARHQLWRRATADWIAGLIVRHIFDEADGMDMIRALAYDLAKEVYRL
jgi:glucuronate isomerase